MEDIEKKVDKMEDASVLPRDGFAGTLNDRCHEVKKEQQNVNISLEEARPKYAVHYCSRIFAGNTDIENLLLISSTVILMDLVSAFSAIFNPNLNVYRNHRL